MKLEISIRQSDEGMWSTFSQKFELDTPIDIQDLLESIISNLKQKDE